MRTPDEHAFHADLEGAPFLLGVIDGRWRLISTTGVIAVIAVAARDGHEYALRFDASDYPAAPPTARLWDAEANAPLENAKWPRSARGGRLGAVFRSDWKSGTALYLPCDREAIEGHDGWCVQMPSKIWRPSVGITHYLEQVHELFHCTDYAAPFAA